MRHGYAVPRGTEPDEERSLTPEGTEQIVNAAVVLARLNIAPTHIFCSPRIRARQTAEAVGDALGKRVEITEDVNFKFDMDILSDYVATYPGEDLMFVGHEPTMSAVIAALSGAEVEMKPGSLARIDLTSRAALRGQLVWLIAPNVFNALEDA